MELTILKDIVVIFALSVFVNFIFNKIKIPTVVGYLLTGIIAGPHLLSLVHGEHEIELMAEIGVIFLLFTIGMEFSLKSLYHIRRTVFLGGLMQFILTSAIFFGLSSIYELDLMGGLFIGFIAALSSSALVLKILQEKSEISSNYGKTVLGILIFQDIMLVPLLLFTNMLGNESINISRELILLGIKAIFIIGLVIVGNKWLFPKLLHWIALTKNQELFNMSIFLICFAIALLTYQLGMSLAFGAFLAGLMISESEYSHNAFGNILPIKDTFTSFFFVSIGMLLDLQFVYDNWLLVSVSFVLVIFVKTLIAGATGFVLGHTFRGTVMVGLALSQVGEFSFVLAKIGNKASVVNDFYYQLFIAVAVITMAVTPFIMNVSRPLATLLLKLPLPPKLVTGLFPLKETSLPSFKNHIVIIGKDPSALKLADMARQNSISYVSIIFDPNIVKEQIEKGYPVVYGDAVNKPILEKAHIENAEIVALSIGNIVPTIAILENIKQMAPNAFVLVRTPSIDFVKDLYRLGADQVLPEKLEIAIDMLNRILIMRKYPTKEVNRLVHKMRNDFLGEFINRDQINQLSIFDEFDEVEVKTITIESNSEAINQSVIEIDLRAATGANLLAVRRNGNIVNDPLSKIQFEEGDVIYLMGSPNQLVNACKFFRFNNSIE